MAEKITDFFCTLSTLGNPFTTKVTPKAASNRIVFADSETGPFLKAYLTQAAEKGKANDALLNLLSENFGCAKSCFEIIAGHTNRLKTIKIKG